MFAVSKISKRNYEKQKTETPESRIIVVPKISKGNPEKYGHLHSPEPANLLSMRDA
jgi:hypothetical protein